MEPLRRTKVKCCQGCKSRSIEPNCHSYCPTYLAEKMALDAERAETLKKAKVVRGIQDQRFACYFRHEKNIRKRKR